MELEKRNAFAYLRVSTRKQDEENQRIQIENYVKNHGVNVPEWAWFTDKISGAKVAPLDRPGFKDLWDSMKALKGTPDCPTHVIVYEISRLGRNFWEMLKIIEVLEAECPIISTSPREAFLQSEDTSFRALFISIMAWVAERERMMTVQRVNDGLERARQENRHSGNAPLGYDQHVCSKLLHERCSESGRLTLNTFGNTVYDLLIMNRNLRAKTIAKGLSWDYWKAAKILASVRKFGNPSEKDDSLALQQNESDDGSNYLDPQDNEEIID